MVRNPKYTLELEEFVRNHLESAQKTNLKINDQQLNQKIKAQFGEEFGKGQLSYLKTKFRNGELGIGNPSHRAAAIAAGLLHPLVSQQTSNAVASAQKSDPQGPKTPVSSVATPIKPTTTPARPVKPAPQPQAPGSHPYPRSLQQVFPDLGLPPLGSHRKNDLAFLHLRRPSGRPDYPGTSHFGDTSSSGSPSPVHAPQDLSKAYETIKTSALLPSKPPADTLPQSQAEKIIPQDPVISHATVIGKTESLVPTVPATSMQAEIDGQIQDDIKNQTGENPYQGGNAQSSGSNTGLSASAREHLRITLEPIDSFDNSGPTQLSPSIFFDSSFNSDQHLQSDTATTSAPVQKTLQAAQISIHQPAGIRKEPPRALSVQQSPNPLSAPIGTTTKANMAPPGGLTHPLPAKPAIDVSQPKRLKTACWQEPSSVNTTTNGAAQTSLASAQEANMRMSQAIPFPSSATTGHAAVPGVNSKAVTVSRSNVSQTGSPRSDILGPSSGLPNLGGLVMPGTLAGAGGQAGKKRRFSQIDGGGATHGGINEPNRVAVVHQQGGGVTRPGSLHSTTYPPLDSHSASKGLASKGNTKNSKQKNNDGQTAAYSGRVESRSFILGSGKDGGRADLVQPEQSKSPTELPVSSPRSANGGKRFSPPPQQNDVYSDPVWSKTNSVPGNPQEDVIMTTDDSLAGLLKYTDEELSAAAMMGDDISITSNNNLVSTGGGGVAHPPPAKRTDYDMSSGPVAQDTLAPGAEPALTYYVVPPAPGPVDVYLCGTGVEACPISPAVVHFHCRRNGTVIFSRMGDFQAAAIMYQRSQQGQSRVGPYVPNSNEG